MNQTFVCKKCGKKFQAINERSRCKDCIIEDNLAKYSTKESEGFTSVEMLDLGKSFLEGFLDGVNSAINNTQEGEEK